MGYSKSKSVTAVTAAEAETQQTTLDTPAARAIYTSRRWYAFPSGLVSCPLVPSKKPTNCLRTHVAVQDQATWISGCYPQLSFSADSRHVDSPTLPLLRHHDDATACDDDGDHFVQWYAIRLGSLPRSASRVRTTVPSCMWWFESDQCNSSGGVDRLSL